MTPWPCGHRADPAGEFSRTGAARLYAIALRGRPWAARHPDPGVSYPHFYVIERAHPVLATSLESVLCALRQPALGDDSEGTSPGLDGADHAHATRLRSM